jgi:hypothetical protein
MLLDHVVQVFVTEAGRRVEDLAARDVQEADRNLASRRLLNASLPPFLFVLRFSALWTQ